MAALLLIDELDPPWAYGSIEITTIPLLDNSIEIFDYVSLDLWNPGITIIRGAGFSDVALNGL